MLRAISLGASGYLLKTATVEQITEGIRTVAAGGASLDAGVARFILESLQTKCELAFRLGVPAAESAIDVIASGFTGIGGGDLTPEDLDALASAVLADHPEREDDNDYHGTLWNYDWEKEGG